MNLISAWGWTLRDGWTMFLRLMKHTYRNPETLLIGIFLPVILMLLFVYVFGGAIQTGTAYVNYIVPAVIVTCVGYGTSMTATGVNVDMNGGLYDRLRSMPVRPVSLLFAHIASSFVRNGIGAALVVLVALAIGFRPAADLGAWLGVVCFLGLFFLAVCWLSVFFGLLAPNPETAGTFGFFIIFLPYASSAFVPTGTMPSWLRVFADHQPFTPLIDTLRGLLLGGGISAGDAWASVAWFGSLLAISFAAALILFVRKKR